MTVRRAPLILLAPIVALAICPPVRPTAQTESTWIEVRTPHFVVITDAAADEGRRVAREFEQVRSVFDDLQWRRAAPSAAPTRIIAARDEATLRSLLPRFWSTAGRARPAGVLLADNFRHYIALRLDVKGAHPYQVLYHEYVHRLLQSEGDRLPVWLNEGLAEFYATMSIARDRVTIGSPHVAHVLRLRRQPLLSPAELLAADRSSPHYTEQERANVFYAQAWALVHYLLLGRDPPDQALLARYLSQLGEGALPLDAARSAFGSLDELFAELSAYVRRPFFPEATVPVTAASGDTGAFAVRELPQAETLARLGDFYIYADRPFDARGLLLRAAQLDPDLALASESLAMLGFRENRRDEALEWAGRAVAGNPDSVIALYLLGGLSMEGATDPAVADAAASRLERAIELDPGFAPAHAALADIHSWREDHVHALRLATRAVELDPATIGHRITLGRILRRLDRVDEARAVGERALARATTAADRALVEDFLRSLRWAGGRDEEAGRGDWNPGAGGSRLRY